MTSIVYAENLTFCLMKDNTPNETQKTGEDMSEEASDKAGAESKSALNDCSVSNILDFKNAKQKKEQDQFMDSVKKGVAHLYE